MDQLNTNSSQTNFLAGEGVSTMPQAPKTPSAFSDYKGIAIGVIIFLVIAGGYAGASFYFKLWPFQSKLNKQLAFEQLFDKIQQINSSSYQVKLDAKTNPREAGAVPFIEAPQAENQNNSLEADQNRLRDLKSIQSALELYKVDHNNLYPEKLDQLKDYLQISTAAYQYSSSADKTDYSLTITFETTDAVDALKKSYNTNQPLIENQKVTFTKKTINNYYYLDTPISQSSPSLLMGGLGIIPADASLTINAGGTSQKNQDQAADASFNFGGTFSMGDMQFAAEAELIKKAETSYIKINKLPGMFFVSLEDLKNKWIKIMPEDLISFDYLTFLGNFLNQKEENNNSVLKQLQVATQLLQDEAVLSVDYSLPDEIIDNQKAFAYNVSYDETKVAAWYTHLIDKLKLEFGDKALMKADEKTLQKIKDPAFEKFLAYQKNNSKLKLLIDKTTGYPIKFVYSMRFVPTDDWRTLKNKQLDLSLDLSLKNINQPIQVAAPADFIPFADAWLTITGMTKEEYEFQKQTSNIDSLRRALSTYYQYAKAYPETLDQLKTSTKDLKAKFGETSSSQPDDYLNLSVGLGGSSSDLQLIKAIPNDAYTKKPYVYAKKDGNYELVYQLNIPKPDKNKTAGAYAYFSGVTEISKYNNGQNTATKDTLSKEIDELMKVDTDKDGLPDVLENYYGSDINKADTDGDGYSDYQEVTKGYDPIGPGKLPVGETWYDTKALNNSYNDDLYNPVKTTASSSTVKISPTDHVIGSANAKITLIVYSDFECPFCSTYNDTLKKILTDYTNQIRFVYRHYPLSTVHLNADKAAEASECANEQGKFWEMHDKLFELNKTKSLNPESMKLAAKDLKLDTKKFNDCLDQNKYAVRIYQDSQQAQLEKIYGTPATIINGEIISGAVDYETLKQTIDRKLK
jgi:protein-disulfide isomerase